MSSASSSTSKIKVNFPARNTVQVFIIHVWCDCATEIMTNQNYGILENDNNMKILL